MEGCAKSVVARRHVHLILGLRHNVPMGFRRARSVLLLGLGMNVLCARTVCAGWGGDAASVWADSNQMQRVLHPYSAPQFGITEITTENGIRAREVVKRRELRCLVA